MRLKLTIVIALLAITTPLLAQKSVIKGEFKKLVVVNNVTEIYLYKQHEGGLMPVSTIEVNKKDFTFETTVEPQDLNQLRYIGIEDEFYPVYLKANEELIIRVNNGVTEYAGKLNRQNTIFSNWVKMLEPLRRFTCSLQNKKLTNEAYVATLDSLITPMNNFTKKIKSGDKKFDTAVKYMLPYEFNYYALKVFTYGHEFPKNNYPRYIVDIFEGEKYSDNRFWDLPFAFNYIMTNGFAKYILYSGQVGYVADMLIPDLTSPEIRANMILKLMELGYVSEVDGFVKSNKQYLLNDDQRAKMDLFAKRIAVTNPGGAWIDFSYPDVNGTMHKLSDYLGKVVVVDVWATWCAPCKREIPFLEELEKNYKDQDVVFISVSFDTDHKVWADFIRENNLSGIQLYSNREGVIVEDYAVVSVPRFMVFSKEGKTVDINAPRPSVAKLKEIIDTELQKKKIAK